MTNVVAVDAVSANGSLHANSLQTGKNTGIFAQFLHFGGFATEIHAGFQVIINVIP
jgi:hypothetical protein